MFPSRKRIFAGKARLHTEPFCPYLTDEHGYFSLKKGSNASASRPAPTRSGDVQGEPSLRNRRSRA